MGKTYQSIVINAPLETVWNRIRDFQNLDWAPNVVTGVEAIGDRKGTEVGARRVLNGAFHETLSSLDEADRGFAYSIDDGPSPVSRNDVSNYTGRVRLLPVTESDATFVEWSSAWERNDEPAAEFCNGIYVALLHDMKKSIQRE